MALGWSAPRSTAGAAACTQVEAPRVICAVSPQDDWIRSGCGCTPTGMRCVTQSGNAGSAFCCPSGCPSTDPGGGVPATQTQSVTKPGISQQPDAPTPAQPQLEQSSTTIWPWLVVGGLGLALVTGVGFWFHRKSKHREMLERTLLALEA